ncbi:hypothetical protein HHK36_028396 [Tetracentron sinense]|uniref:Protein transport protein SEC23 n=1 Tax=Tetracentron sinense TaxID=13715 RepID=A0A835D0J6_TETSI|nr:hypothetical protein HHK36_028396 [Tetracentron sinense]
MPRPLMVMSPFNAPDISDILRPMISHLQAKDLEWVSLKDTVSFTYSCIYLVCSGTFEVNCSKDIKVQGIIGPCASLEKKGPLCSETIVGQGNTSAWKMCGLDKATSLCLVFEIVKKDIPDATGQPTSNQFYIQLLT